VHDASCTTRPIDRKPHPLRTLDEGACAHSGGRMRAPSPRCERCGRRGKQDRTYRL
jgi:hypothetical protein